MAFLPTASSVHVVFALFMASPCCLLSSAFAVPGFSSIINHQNNAGQTSQIPRFMSTSSAARDLLYQDQQQAMLRRALVEEELLASRTSILEAPANLKTKGAVQSGTGFGGGKAAAVANQGSALAQQQAKILKRDGVIRIANVLTPQMADNLRSYVLEQQILASQATQQNPALARSFYGVEQARAHRCDLQLSLLRGGYAADITTAKNDEVIDAAGGHVLSDALQEVLGSQGTLRPLYEKLVTKEGEFYEFAAVITDPGSNRQIIHPDLPYQAKAPLYVVFVALQDVTESMGPTSFLLGTHTKSQNAIFSSGSVAEKNDQLAAADCRLSCLPKGHAVVFDARLLHCGNANTSDQTRAMWNFSFRNPAVTGDLGYKGSIRPGYCEAMTLADVGSALASYQNGNPDPFAQYGSGLL